MVARRRRLRVRGSSGTLLASALLTGVLGAGMAVGHEVQQRPAGAAAVAGILQAGSTGEAVAALQRKLGGLAVDGVYGPRTKAAVTRFQQRNGLMVDGIAGPQTLGALGLAGRAGSASSPAQSQQQPSAPTAEAPAAPEPPPAEPPAREQPEAPPQPQAREEAAPDAQPERPSQEPAPRQPAAGGDSGTLQRIAQCESGGNPRAVSPDGRYRGKYQFHRDTWRDLGGEGDPARAPEAEQDRRAQELYQRRGTSPWSNCA